VDIFLRNYFSIFYYQLKATIAKINMKKNTIGIEISSRRKSGLFPFLLFIKIDFLTYYPCLLDQITTSNQFLE